MEKSIISESLQGFGIGVLIVLIGVCLGSMHSCVAPTERMYKISLPEEVKVAKTGDTLIITNFDGDLHVGFYHGGEVKRQEALYIVQ